MSEALIIGGVMALSGITVVGYTISTYNYFIAGRQSIKTQFSNIKTEYQRRFDLFMNLVVGIKSYKKHEKTTLTDVTKARSALNFAGDMKAQIKKAGFLDQFLSKLAVVVESYPQLKADAHHTKLLEELRITEDRINVARTSYNDLVREYNTSVKSFPSNVIASMFRFNSDPYYLNQQGDNNAPKINLD